MPPDRWNSLWRNSLWRAGRVLWLLLLAVALLAAGALWGFWDYQRLVTDLAVESEGRTTQLAAVRIRDELAQFPDALINLARSADIISQDPARVQEALHEAPPVQEGLFDAGLLLLNNFGVVAAVPNRHTLLWHPIVDPSALRAIDALVVMAANLCAEGPGSISPHLYWWKDGTLATLPTRETEEHYEFVPPDDFVDEVLEKLAARAEMN